MLGPKRYHLGFRRVVARSTLADANETHDWRIFADFAQHLIGIARPLYAGDTLGVDLDASLYALDSTTIDLCLALFPWARFRTRKAAVKMHTLLDLQGNIPAFIHVSDGKMHDVHALDRIQIEAQQQNTLKEPSLVFVRSQVQNQVTAAAKANSDSDGAALLEVAPGTRIQAKLETQISSAVQAPVVAVVEYTYAIGDKVVVPAGARVYGQLQQADRSGLISVKFDEIELLDGAREKIDAIGTGLDLDPLKGAVSGQNTGKNFLVRTASGISSVAAMLVGNNTSASFSEDDLLRERVAQNIGTAGDSEVMSLAAKSRVVVSVPADTKIYIVFTKHEQNSHELHKVASAAP